METALQQIDPLELKLLAIAAVGGLVGVGVGACLVLWALNAARKRAEENPRRGPGTVAEVPRRAAAVPQTSGENRTI